MLESIPVTVAVGTVLGFLGGIGVGGGSLLILWLTAVLDMEHTVARSINLLFFLPCATVATCFRWKQGNLDLRRILPGVIAGCVAAFFFSQLSTILDMELLKKLFGGLLLFTGIRELFWRPEKKK